jgi:glutathione S-transferase
MKLYSAWYCPFAQRVWMSLLYKQVEFEYIEVDPYDETPEWLVLSKGAGTVPVITTDKETIVDSTVIMLQLDELYPETTPIFYTNPNERKVQEAWIEHINNKIIPFFYLYLKAHIEGEQRDEYEQQLRDGLSIFASALDYEGPYFNGKTINAVDFSLFPFAYRINLLLGYYRNFSLPELGDSWFRYHEWFNTMLTRPEFKNTTGDSRDYDQRLLKAYYPYSQGGGKLDLSTLTSE